ncbi:hypothetical protein MPTK1_3g09890 [Marchantia polymorpha subsp. ruderalis]|uniref:glutamate formimidoyltransferase n=2 Tax=Marchantia polymorpha TaxID=3197 RepID=A0AAF6AZ71_MARPO|nr:hypothetical protein MARPO_0085s0037 [Marchantia polymorpha]BBN05055.1 hypothetical protein Mp_3g09890 [Marchantia polymorpha subsp. ruderalis]|eukprot:PTQ33818.1 hypothetical protein MARPO_0085s0037 [Marchantia polymorpha]
MFLSIVVFRFRVFVGVFVQSGLHSWILQGSSRRDTFLKLLLVQTRENGPVVVCCTSEPSLYAETGPKSLRRITAAQNPIRSPSHAARRIPETQSEPATSPEWAERAQTAGPECIASSLNGRTVLGCSSIASRKAARFEKRQRFCSCCSNDMRMAAAGELRRLALACCKLYISDSKNVKALETIERAARSQRLAPLLHIFEDKEYNRVGYTLAGPIPFPSHDQKKHPFVPEKTLPIRSAVMAMVKAAVDSIDLQEHVGSHPRLGVVDHLCFHAIGSASLEQAASLARTVAADIASDLQVPTFVYGAAHEDRRPLDAIRRELGYFRCNSLGHWEGTPELPSELSPDFGPSIASPKTGVVVVGACPWVMNYNVPIQSTDLVTGRKIAKKVSERGGGLADVQAMALLHGEARMEIACNLLDVQKSSPQMVQNLVASLGESAGVDVGQGYLTGQSDEEIFELALEKLFTFQ